MAPRKKITFHERIQTVLKDLNEKIEVSEKDILGESAKLYRFLYDEALRETGAEGKTEDESEDMTDIPRC